MTWELPLSDLGRILPALLILSAAGTTGMGSIISSTGQLIADRFNGWWIQTNSTGQHLWLSSGKLSVTYLRYDREWWSRIHWPHHRHLFVPWHAAGKQSTLGCPRRKSRRGSERLLKLMKKITLTNFDDLSTPNFTLLTKNSIDYWRQLLRNIHIYTIKVIKCRTESIWWT